jgi:AbrB family looped-hinge helix DNA binding protein
MGIAKVTRNFQVTIPKDVRRIKGIHVGDTVLFTIEQGRIDFVKLNKAKLIEETAGIWKGKIKGSSSDYVQSIRKEWAIREKREKR